MHSHRFGSAVAAATAAFWLSTAPLGAQTAMPPLPPAPGTVALDDNFYAVLGGTYQRVQLPRNKWGFSALSGDQEPNKDIWANTAGPSFAFGYAFSSPGAWLGARPRVEVGGMYLLGSGRASAKDVNGQTNDVIFRFINGANNFTAGLPVVLDFNVKATTEIGEAFFAFKTDYSLGSRVVFTPGIGLIGGLQRTRYANHIGISFSGLEVNEQLATKVTATRFGGELSGALGFRATDAFTIHLGATGAIFRQDARFVANQCVNSLLFSNECQPFPPFSPSQEGGRVTVGYRAGASLGFSYDMGWAKLSLIGNAALTTKVPTIDYPMPNEVRGTRMVYDNRWNYGGTIALTVPFD